MSEHLDLRPGDVLEVAWPHADVERMTVAALHLGDEWSGGYGIEFEEYGIFGASVILPIATRAVTL